MSRPRRANARRLALAGVMGWAVVGCQASIVSAPLPEPMERARGALFFPRGLSAGFETYELGVRTLPDLLEVDPDEPPALVAFACDPALLELPARGDDLSGLPCLTARGRTFTLAQDPAGGWAWVEVEAELRPPCGECARRVVRHRGSQIRFFTEGRLSSGLLWDDETLLVANEMSGAELWRLRAGEAPVRLPIEPALPSGVITLRRSGPDRVELIGSEVWEGTLDLDEPAPRLRAARVARVGVPLVPAAVAELANGEALVVSTLGALLHRDAAGTWSVVVAPRPTVGPLGHGHYTPASVTALPSGHPLGTALVVGTASTSEIRFIASGYRLPGFVAFPSLRRFPLSSIQEIVRHDGQTYATNENSDLFLIDDTGAAAPQWLAPAPMHAEPLASMPDGLLVTLDFGRMQLFLPNLSNPCELLFLGQAHELESTAIQSLLTRGDRLHLIYRSSSVLFGEIVDRAERCAL